MSFWATNSYTSLNNFANEQGGPGLSHGFGYVPQGGMGGAGYNNALRLYNNSNTVGFPSCGGPHGKDICNSRDPTASAIESGMPPPQTTMEGPMRQFHDLRPPRSQQQQIYEQQTYEQPTESSPQFRNSSISRVYALLGEPDLYDNVKGGLCLWNNSSLQKRGFVGIRRVEVIDEKIRCDVPVKHFGSVYIWIKCKPTNCQLENINEYFPNAIVDRLKQQVIIRSDSLESCVATALLIKQYVAGEISMYEIYYNDLLKKSYRESKKKFVRNLKLLRK
jgi:hypothetical protein